MNHRISFFAGACGVLGSLSVYYLWFSGAKCRTFLEPKAIDHCDPLAIIPAGLMLVLGILLLWDGFKKIKNGGTKLESSHLICKNCETPHNIHDNPKVCKECGGELVSLEGFYNTKKSVDVSKSDESKL